MRWMLWSWILTLFTAVGLVIGFIFGATNIIRFGPGPNGMMRTLGQYMVGSAATFGYVQRVRRHSKFSFLTILQLLHVHWHDHPHRELAHPYRSFRQGSGEPRRPSHHEEEEGTDDAADPGSVDGNMKNGGHVQKTKLGLEVASPRSRMYYTERNFKPITSIMGKSFLFEWEV
jgi:hypothetical protein